MMLLLCLLIVIRRHIKFVSKLQEVEHTSPRKQVGDMPCIACACVCHKKSFHALQFLPV